MKNFGVAVEGWLVAATCASAQAGIVSHNGTLACNPLVLNNLVGGTGPVHVGIRDDSPGATLNFSFTRMFCLVATLVPGTLGQCGKCGK